MLGVPRLSSGRRCPQLQALTDLHRAAAPGTALAVDASSNTRPSSTATVAWLKQHIAASHRARFPDEVSVDNLSGGSAGQCIARRGELRGILPRLVHRPAAPMLRMFDRADSDTPSYVAIFFPG